MKLDLTEIINLVNYNKFHDALKLINELENNHSEDFELINLKGFILLRLDEFEKSIEYFTKALLEKKNSFLTLCYRSAAYSEIGNYEKALSDLKEAEMIQPNSHEIFFSIGDAYSNLGNNDKAIEYFIKSIEIENNFDPAKENLITKLTEINTFEKTKSINKIVKTHNAINKIEYIYSQSNIIKEESLKAIFDKANKLINQNFHNLITNQTQIFRRNKDELKCDRHFLIFNNFNAIPKFCFNCFKVTIEVENVIDLIKLYIVFDNISFTKNNIRKCMIESRPDIKGNYKGFIYCNSLSEAKNVKTQFKKIIEKNINPNLSPEIKRGCSEFAEKFPKYKDFENDSMKYDNSWEKYENMVDKKFSKFKSNRDNKETSKGINLKDILIIKNWLLFAKLTGDNSYKKISDESFNNEIFEKEFSRKIRNLNNI